MEKFSIFFILLLLLAFSSPILFSNAEEIKWLPDDIKFSHSLTQSSTDNSFSLTLSVNSNGEIQKAIGDQGHIRFQFEFNYKDKYNLFFNSNCLSLALTENQIQAEILSNTYLNYTNSIDVSDLDLIGSGSISLPQIIPPPDSDGRKSPPVTDYEGISLSSFYKFHVRKSKIIDPNGFESSSFVFSFIPHTKKINVIRSFSYKIITTNCQSIHLSNLWNNPARWSLNRVPISTDDVIIPSNSTAIILENNVEIQSLTMLGGHIISYDTSCPLGWTLDERDMSPVDDYYTVMEDNFNNHGQGTRRRVNNDNPSTKIEREFHGRKCYKLVNQPMNFWEAENHCHNVLGRGSGSHLIHISDHQELNLLYRLCRDSRESLGTQFDKTDSDFSAQKNLGCWIGMYDHTGYGDFDWIDSSFSLDTTKLTEKSSDELFSVIQKKLFLDWRRFEPDNYTYFSPTSEAETFLTELNDISGIYSSDPDAPPLSYTSNAYFLLLIDKLKLNHKQASTLLLSGERCVSTVADTTTDPLLKEQGGWSDSFCFVRKPFVCQLISTIKKYKLKINGSSEFLGGSIEGGHVYLYGQYNVFKRFLLYRGAEMYLYGEVNRLDENLTLLDGSKLFLYSNLIVPSSPTQAVFIGEPSPEFPLHYNYFFQPDNLNYQQNLVFEGENMDGLAQSVVTFGINSNVLVEEDTKFILNAALQSSGLITIEENSDMKLQQGGDLSSSSIELSSSNSNITFSGYSSRLSIYDSFELSTAHNGVVLGEYFEDPIKEIDVKKGNKPFGIYRLLVSVKRIYEDDDEYTEEEAEGGDFKIFNENNFIFKEEVTSCIPYDATSTELKTILEKLSIVKELGGVNIRRIGNKNLKQHGYGYTYRIEFNKVLRKKFFNSENLKYYTLRLNLNIGCYGDDEYSLTGTTVKNSCGCGEAIIPMKSLTSNAICKLPLNFNTQSFFSYSSSPISTYYLNNAPIVDQSKQINEDPDPDLEFNPSLLNYIDDSNLNSFSIYYSNLYKFINSPAMNAEDFLLDKDITSNINVDSCLLAPYFNIKKLTTNSFMKLTGLGTLNLEKGYHRLPEILLSEVQVSLHNSSIGIIPSDFILYPFVNLLDFSKLYISSVGWNGWDSFIYIYESEEWKNERSLVNYLITASTSLVYIDELNMNHYSNFIVTTGENYIGDDEEYKSEFYSEEFFLDKTFEPEGYNIEANIVEANNDNLDQFNNVKFDYEGRVIHDISEGEKEDLENADLILSKRDVAFEVLRSNLYVKKNNFNGGIFRGKASIFVTESLSLDGSLKGFADGLFYIITPTCSGEWNAGNITMSNGAKFILEGYLKVKNKLEVDEDENFIDEVIRFDIENENISDDDDIIDPATGTSSFTPIVTPPESLMNPLEISETLLINVLNYQNVNYRSILRVSPVDNFNSYYSENLLVKKQQNSYRNPSCSYYCGRNSVFIMQKNANFTVLNKNNLSLNLNLLLINSTNRVILKDISKISLKQNSLLNNLATIYLLTTSSVINFYSNNIFMLKQSKIYGDGILVVDSGSHTVGSILNCDVLLLGGEIIWPKSRQSLLNLGLETENDNRITFNKNLIMESSSKFSILNQNTIITVKENLVLSDNSRIQFPLIGTVKERISYDSLDAPDDTPRCLLTVLNNFYFYAGIIEGKGDFIIKSYLLLDSNDKYKLLKEGNSTIANVDTSNDLFIIDAEDPDAALFPELFPDSSSTSSDSITSSNKYIKSLAKLVNDGFCEWNSGDIMITDFGDFINRGTIEIMSSHENKVLSAFYKGTAVSLENGGDYFAKDYHTYDIDPGNLDFSEYLKLKSMYA